MKKVCIGTRGIGPGEPCYVIAEAGSNHNGSLPQALKLIDVAARSKVDAVKFQLFRASRMYPRSAGSSAYLKTSRPIYDIISEMEMPYEWLPTLSDRCEQNGVELLVSVFDEESVDRLEPYVRGFKVASYEMTHLPLLQHVCSKGKPIFMSTGAAQMAEVTEAVEVCRAAGAQELVLMQCTAAYPAPLESLNVRAIRALEREFAVPIGLSDHSRDPLVGPLAAVACGAAVIEKHFTLSNDLPGPDHSFALEPSELRLLVEKVRGIESALGHEAKVVESVEHELRGFARRSIFALQDIEAGDVFGVDNLAVLRCGENAPGLPPSAFPEIVGRRAVRRVRADTVIEPDDVV